MSYRAHSISAQDGTALFYRDYTSGKSPNTALLCLPGLLRNSADFHDLAERQCANRRVLAIDYRGRGLSGWADPTTYHPHSYVLDIHHILAAANCHRVIIVGTSLGGLLAMGMGALMPATIAGVVLNDIGPELDASGLERIKNSVGTTLAPKTYAEAAIQIKNLYQNAYPDYQEEDWMQEAKLSYRQDANGRLERTYDPEISQSVSGGKEEELDLWALFRSLSGVPVFSIRGERSDLFSKETQDRMADQHPQFTQTSLANRGHTPNLNEPEIEDALTSFFELCDQTGH